MQAGTFIDERISSWGWGASDARYGRLPGMDVLKILAIIFVVLTHCYTDTFRAVRVPELWIEAAVPVFIIIGAFNYCRKAVKMKLASPRGWYTRRNLFSYFKRIGIPFIVFMIAQLIVLPLIGYAPVTEVLLNTVKGGMGAGGYYLVVFVQLFLLVPFFYFALKRRPFLTLLVAFAVRVAFGALCERVLMPLDPYVFEGVNKLLSVRFFVCIACGMTVFLHYEKFTPRMVTVMLLGGFVISATKFFFGGTGVYEADLAWSCLQQALWCTGITVMLLKGFVMKDATFAQKVMAFIAGSTLHILLFQQIYFCGVGVGRHLAYIDAPAALLGGLAVYILWTLAEKKAVPLARQLLSRAAAK